MIVSTPREALWVWMNQRLGTPWSDDFRAIGKVVGNDLKAAVGYNSFVGKTCCIHVAIEDPAVIDRAFVRAAFEYPFTQCGVHVLLGLVDSENSKAIEFNRKLGFKEAHFIPEAGLHGDLLIFQMRKSDCRWTKVKHGKEIRTPGS